MDLAGSGDLSTGVNGLNNLINKYNSTICRNADTSRSGVGGSRARYPGTACGSRCGCSDCSSGRPGTKANPLFYTTEIRLSWSLKIKERLTILPMVDCFNIFNKTNISGPLSGVVSQGPGTINSMTSYFTRVGAGSGSFSSGQPRAFQFGIRVSF
jgi:hypothetical protein